MPGVETPGVAARNVMPGESEGMKTHEKYSD
jgi:hypothetical protein